VTRLALRPLARESDRDALAAAATLAGADDPEGDAALIRLLAGAPDAAVRAQAASQLSRLPGDHVLPPLARALGDRAAEVRVEAAAALLRALSRG